jgi:futalosine hydrolase
MRILIVAATEAEIAPLAAPVRASVLTGLHAFKASGHAVEILVTGVGMVATAAKTARALAQTRYDLALNLGVCGSFDPRLNPGRVVHVMSDRIAELGAEDGDAFLTFEDLRLPGDPVFVNAHPPENELLSNLPSVSGITVNTVHGNARSIAAVVRRFSPQVESMEGAAFMHACLISELPFAQVRAVSNLVETRDREAWNLREAIGNLNRCARGILDRL